MKIHQLPGYIQSIYLIEYPHGLLLLDGCCRADVRQLKDFIKTELNRPITDLKTVVVTHMHPDHAGAANKLRQISGCLVVSADKPTQWYHGLNGLLMHWIDVVLTLYVGRKLRKGIKNVAYSRKLHPDKTVKSGDPVPHFHDWSIVETPGHTDRDLSILHCDKKWIYVADLIIKLKNRFVSPFPVFHPNQYKNSLLKVKQLEVQNLMLAHGGILTMNNEDFTDMLAGAPSVPRTPLRASLLKIKKITGQ